VFEAIQPEQYPLPKAFLTHFPAPMQLESTLQGLPDLSIDPNGFFTQTPSLHSWPNSQSRLLKQVSDFACKAVKKIIEQKKRTAMFKKTRFFIILYLGIIINKQ
jgi:hypothetical protein